MGHDTVQEILITWGGWLVALVSVLIFLRSAAASRCLRKEHENLESSAMSAGERLAEREFDFAKLSKRVRQLEDMVRSREAEAEKLRFQARASMALVERANNEIVSRDAHVNSLAVQNEELAAHAMRAGEAARRIRMVLEDAARQVRAIEEAALGGEQSPRSDAVIPPPPSRDRYRSAS